jgi:hypothetical protein
MNVQTTEPAPNLASEIIDLMSNLLRWQDHIEAAMAHVYDMYTFNDVVASVLRGERQFHDFGDACAIMEVCQFSQWSSYHVFVACGNMRTLKQNESVINGIAKSIGCKYMSLSGRIGWPRALKENGWKHTMSVLHKEVY